MSSYNVAKAHEREHNYHAWGRSIVGRCEALRKGKTWEGKPPQPVKLRDWNSGETITVMDIQVGNDFLVHAVEWNLDQKTRWESLRDFVEVGVHEDLRDTGDDDAYVPEEQIKLLALANAGDKDAIAKLMERYRTDEPSPVAESIVPPKPRGRPRKDLAESGE